MIKTRAFSIAVIAPILISLILASGCRRILQGPVNVASCEKAEQLLRASAGEINMPYLGALMSFRNETRVGNAYMWDYSYSQDDEAKAAASDREQFRQMCPNFEKFYAGVLESVFKPLAARPGKWPDGSDMLRSFSVGDGDIVRLEALFRANPTFYMANEVRITAYIKELNRLAQIKLGKDWEAYKNWEKQQAAAEAENTTTKHTALRCSSIRAIA